MKLLLCSVLTENIFSRTYMSPKYNEYSSGTNETRSFQHNSGAAGRNKNSSAAVSDDLRRAASIGCLSRQQQQTVDVVAAAGVDPASVSPVGAGAIPDIFDGQGWF